MSQEKREPAAPKQPALQVASPDDITTPSMPRPRRTNPRIAFSSAYAPHGRRKLWAVAARCPRCGHTSLHRGPSLHSLDGQIRAGSCRHWYRVRVMRCYPAAARVEAAA